MTRIFKFNPTIKKEEIYFKYGDAMMLVCIRYTGNKEDAEEVMNNGFLKVFKNLANFNNSSVCFCNCLIISYLNNSDF